MSDAKIEKLLLVLMQSICKGVGFKAMTIRALVVFAVVVISLLGSREDAEAAVFRIGFSGIQSHYDVNGHIDLWTPDAYTGRSGWAPSWDDPSVVVLKNHVEVDDQWMFSSSGGVTYGVGYVTYFEKNKYYGPRTQNIGANLFAKMQLSSYTCSHPYPPSICSQGGGWYQWIEAEFPVITFRKVIDRRALDLATAKQVSAVTPVPLPLPGALLLGGLALLAGVRARHRVL